MDCLDDNVVGAFVEGKLDAEALAELEAHVDLCADCRELLGAVARADSSSSHSSEEPEPLHLAPGDSIEHFQVVRWLGRGAMGEVYLARDTKLGRKVALKLIRPDALGDAQAVQRLLEEARITACFNHPNILTVYQVGEHRCCPYLALEYLEGQSLRAYTEHQRLTLGQTLRIGLAIAEALVEAHRCGVLHRDLKPENVFMPLDGRPRVLDFGIAKLVGSEELPAGADAVTAAPQAALADTIPVTGPGSRAVCGTPAYMAPEQWRAQPTAASDMWAFGMVLHELVTGSRPFEAHQVAATARHGAALATPALPGGTPPGVVALINSCLELEPDRRANAAQTVAQLKDLLHEQAESALRAVRHRLRLALAVAALLLLVGGAAALLAVKRAARQPSTESSFSGRPSVAIVSINGESPRPDDAWLGAAFTELLTSELAASEAVLIASPGDVTRASRDLALRNDAPTNDVQRRRLAKLLGVRHLVVGSYRTSGPEPSATVVLNLRLVDSETCRTTQVPVVTGTRADLLRLASNASLPLRKVLGVAASPASVEPSGSLPRDGQAVRLYLEGLRLKRVGLFSQARARFEAAARREPEHALLQVALAETAAELGEERRAREAWAAARAHASQLSRRDRLWIEAHYLGVQGQRRQAIENLRLLVDFFPDTVEYVTALVEELLSAGDAAGAAAALTEARQRKLTAAGALRLEMAESMVCSSRSDWACLRAVSQRAVAKAQQSGARHLEISALCELAWSLAHTAGPDQAEPILLQAVAKARALGDPVLLTKAIHSQSMLAGTRGQCRRWREHELAALELARRQDNHLHAYYDLHNLAEAECCLGNVDVAEAHFREALDRATKLNLPSQVGWERVRLARIALSRGDLRETERLLEFGRPLVERSADARSKAYVKQVDASLALYSGDFNRALALLSELRAFADERDLRPHSAQSEALRCWASLLAGNPAAALREIKPLKKTGPFPWHQDSARAARHLARFRLGQDTQACADLEALRQEINSVDAFDIRSRMQMVIAVGRTCAPDRDLDRGLAELVAVEKQARQRQFVLLALDALLERGLLELRSGRHTQGQSTLQSLEQEARRRHLTGYERAAAAARKSR